MHPQIKSKILEHLPGILNHSLNGAAQEQDLIGLRSKLADIVPDIKDQYSARKIDSPYLEAKVRNMHAFQISLVEPVLREFGDPYIVDIGDSAGTHLQYLKALYSDGKPLRCLSVNIDPNAVDRIKKKGIDAVLSRAEDLLEHQVQADIFLCFEMLEHLMDPCHFLHQLSTRTEAKYFILTVPFLKKSRVGLHQIRKNRAGAFGAETTHLFELSPEDWKLIFKISGWNVVHEKIYTQYPRRHWSRVTQYYWRKYDFEGFYGARLTRDHQWSSKYEDWS